MFRTFLFSNCVLCSVSFSDLSSMTVGLERQGYFPPNRMEEDNWWQRYVKNVICKNKMHSEKKPMENIRN